MRRRFRFAECTLPSHSRTGRDRVQPRMDDDTLAKAKVVSGKLKELTLSKLEKAYVFDTETFVTAGAFPVIGSALSSEAAYVWLAAEMCDPLIPERRVDIYIANSAK